MQFIQGKKYLYSGECKSVITKEIESFSIELIFDEKLTDFVYFNCNRCGKEVKSPYIFYDANPGNCDPSSYCFGSECIKKINIKEVK